MNGYQRMRATLQGKQVDYTPSMELMIDDVVIKATVQSGDYGDFCEAVGLDAVLTPTPSKLYRNEIINKEKGIFKNEWGTVRQQGTEVVSAIIDEPIKTDEDVFSYIAPDPLDDYRYTELKKLVARFKGEKLIGMHIHDAFNYPYYLAGMENLFVMMYENPEAVHKLVDISVNHNIALAKKAISLGADFIILGDDYGGGNQLLVSPGKFREFFLPGLQKVVTAVKEEGAYCFKHCCGDINEILKDMVDTGIDLLHPLDPSANMDITAVKAQYPNLVVMGGINCYEPLCQYSLEEVETETKRVIDLVGKNGRYVIASSNSVHSDVKPENYLKMQEIRKSVPVKYE